MSGFLSASPVIRFQKHIKSSDLTDGVTVLIADGEVDLSLRQSLVRKRSIEHVTHVARAENKDVGINAMGKTFHKADTGCEAARLKGRARLNIELGVHFVGVNTPDVRKICGKEKSRTLCYMLGFY